MGERTLSCADVDVGEATISMRHSTSSQGHCWSLVEKSGLLAKAPASLFAVGALIDVGVVST